MAIPHNYLPDLYQKTSAPRINHNYLLEQFSDYAEILRDIETLIKTGDYTLGKSVDQFEANIAKRIGSRFVIGVGSGTDALFLSLKAGGIKEGDEIVTTPYTFVATLGAIVTAGARPVFVDIRADYNIDPDKIEAAISPRTRAILPVHWAGLPCDMNKVMEVAGHHHLFVIEDACHALEASFRGKAAGTFGLTGCFSLHPLKNLNVWGDGGFIVTDSPEMHDQLVLLRNHGLMNRETCLVFAYNSRLDSIQAIVANHLLKKIETITACRIANARAFDQKLAGIEEILIPPRPHDVKQVFHLYIVRAQRRDELVKFLNANDIDAKVHYPIPMHLQPAAREFGWKRGDFPICESICDSILSLPVHEFVTEEDVDFVASKIKEFYGTRTVR